MGGDSFSEGTDGRGNNVPHWAGKNGTWLWDGADWTRVAANPQGGYPALAGERSKGQLLVSCPDIRDVETTDDLETSDPSWYGSGSYRWTGTAGERVAANDSSFIQSAVAYDPMSRRLIQFGGTSRAPSDATTAYDGTGWTTLHRAATPPFGTALAATDETANQIVLLAYSVDHPQLATTWIWDGRTWVRRIVNEPPLATVGLGDSQLIWNPAVVRIVLIPSAGGSSMQTWTWGGTTAGRQMLAS